MSYDELVESRRVYEQSRNRLFLSVVFLTASVLVILVLRRRQDARRNHSQRLPHPDKDDAIEVGSRRHDTAQREWTPERAARLERAGNFIMLLAMGIGGLFYIGWFLDKDWLPVQTLAAVFSLIWLSQNLLSRAEKEEVKPNSVSDLLRMDRRPPILFLRQFRDAERPAAKPGPFGAVTDVAILEDAVLKPLRTFGPVIALGNPVSPTAPTAFGVAFVEDSRWREAIAEYMAQASLVIVLLAESENLFWEIRYLIERGMLFKTVIVWAANSSEECRRVWLQFVDECIPAEEREAMRASFESQLAPLEEQWGKDTGCALGITFDRSTGQPVLLDEWAGDSSDLSALAEQLAAMSLRQPQREAST